MPATTSGATPRRFARSRSRWSRIRRAGAVRRPVRVKFGDVFSYYSDSRSLMTGPDSLWEDEGNERWYRWQALWPQVGWAPIQSGTI